MKATVVGDSCGSASVRVDVKPSADPILHHTWRVSEVTGNGPVHVWEQQKDGGPEASLTVPYNFESCRSYEIELSWFHVSLTCPGHTWKSARTTIGVEPPAGLEAWWTGDQTRENQSSSLHHGFWQANGSTPAAAGRYAPGKVQEAFDFEGSTQFVEIAGGDNRFNFAGASVPGHGAYSIDAWVYNPPAVANSRQPIFYNLRCDRSSGPDSVCSSAGGPGGGTGYGFEMWNNGGVLTLRLLEASFGGSVANEAISQPVPLAGAFDWRFVAVTVDRQATNRVQFYVDGVPVACASGCGVDPGPMLNFSGPRIGADEAGTSPGNPYRTHAGRIDELEFFRSLLTPAQVMEIFEAGKCGKCRFGYRVVTPTKSYVCPGDPQISRTIKVCNETDSGQDMNLTSSSTEGILENYLPSVCNSSNYLPAQAVSFRTNNQSTAPGRYQVDARECTSIVADIDTTSITSVGQAACYGIDAQAVSGDGGAYEVGTIAGVNCTEGSAFSFPLDVDSEAQLGSSLLPVTGGATTPGWIVRNSTGASATVDFSLAATPIGREEGPVGLSLAGLAEGDPYEGTVVMASGATSVMSTTATVLEFRPKDLYRFTLSIDTDRDGDYDLSSDALMEPILSSPRCPEDFDYDRSGDVDNLDLALLVAALSAYEERYDHDSDEFVDQSDIALWQDCFDRQVGNPGPRSTPLVGPLLDRGDLDQDGVTNALDNCPQAANPLQEDDDGDHTGNACEVVASDVQEWVRIGDPGNPLDAMGGGFGAVATDFEIGKLEVTNVQYAAFLKAVAANDVNGLFATDMQFHPLGGIERIGTSGGYTYSVKPGFENLPVNFVSFWDAVRYANWLTNGSPIGSQGASTTEDGSYLLTATAIGNNTVTRRAGAAYFIPTVDEWYKSAYYDDVGGYFSFPTRSYAAPMCSAPSPNSNAANCGNAVGSPSDVGAYTAAESTYRTNDQGGNVAEWNESNFPGGRAVSGGGFGDSVELLSSTQMEALQPTVEADDLGFRISRSCAEAVPEPESLASLIAGVLFVHGLTRCRQRRASTSARAPR